MARFLPLLCFCLFSLVPDQGRAALPQSMKMELVLDASVSDCPSDEALLESVRKRLGYNPFGASDGALFRVNVRRGPSGYDAVIEHFTAQGTSIGERRLESESQQCSDVFEAVALSLALAAGPETPRVWGPRPRPPEGPVRASRSSLWLPFFFQTSDLEEKPIPLDTSWHVGLLGTLGRSPSPGLAALLGVRLRWAALSVDLELEAQPPLPSTVKGTTLSVAHVLFGASICLRNTSLGACVRTEAGLTHAVGSPLDDASAAITPALASGLSADWRLLTREHAYLALKLRALIPIFRTTLKVSGADLWTTPPIHGDLGLCGGMLF